jgi:hypothetical protein
MKRLPLLLSMSAALAFAFAGSATADTQDHVLGGGKSVTDLINISAHSGPAGESPWGHLKAQNQPAYPVHFDIEGNVTCLRVLGNTAVLGIRNTKLEATGYPPSVYPGTIQFVTDGALLGIPDSISYQFPVTFVPTVCPVPSMAFTIFPMTQGNFVVQDN